MTMDERTELEELLTPWHAPQGTGSEETVRPAGGTEPELTDLPANVTEQVPGVTSTGSITDEPIEPSGPVEDLIDHVKEAGRDIKEAMRDAVTLDHNHLQPPQNRRA